MLPNYTRPFLIVPIQNITIRYRVILKLLFIFFFQFLNFQTLTANEQDHAKISVKNNFSITYPKITLPDITMVNTDNKSVNLITELNKGPVIINFIFTSCTAICPVLSSTFSQVQKRFKEINNPFVNLISFSIDPQTDTPSRLKKYAQKFNAGTRWNFFTGSKVDMLNIEQTFKNYRGNKMSHLPYTFIRTNKNSQWIRLKGFVSATVIINEINKIISY